MCSCENFWCLCPLSLTPLATCFSLYLSIFLNAESCLLKMRRLKTFLLIISLTVYLNKRMYDIYLSETPFMFGLLICRYSKRVRSTEYMQRQVRYIYHPCPVILESKGHTQKTSQFFH